jgi:hypothetical protein
MTNYTAVADAGYLKRLSVLYASMQRHCRPCRLHVLALDADVEAWCRAQGVAAASLSALQGAHPELVSPPGPPRTAAERAWTARPAFSADVIERTGGGVVQLDVDQAFYSSPAPVLREIEGAQLALTPHWALPRSAGFRGATLETHGACGTYNAGFSWLGTVEVARWWAAELVSWCYARVERGLYGDQGCLERPPWPVHVIQHPGVNLGPWAIHRRKMERTVEGAITVDGVPLVSYHFCGFRGGWQNPLRGDPVWQITPDQRRLLYDDYELALVRA